MQSLKAVATLQGLEVPRTHDLAALAQTILDSGTALPLTVDQLRDLNPFAVEYRYEDELIPKISREALAAMLAVVMVGRNSRFHPDPPSRRRRLSALPRKRRPACASPL